MPQAQSPAPPPSGSDAPAPDGSAPDAGFVPPSKKKLTAVKGVFAGDYSGVRGTFLVMMDMDQQSLHRLHVVVASDKGEFRFQIKQDWKGFEDSIIRAKLQGYVAHQLSMEVQSYVKRMLTEEAGVSICENIRTGHPDEIRRVLVEVLSRAIADSDILMEIDVEDVAEAVPAEPAQAASEEAPVAASEGEAIKALQQEVVLRVEPLLSPVYGVAAKELKPGMHIIVEIKEQSTLKQNVSKLLAVRGSGEKPTAIGTVIDIAPGVHDRMTIRVSLAPNVVGITNIFGDLRLKVPEAQAARAFAALQHEQVIQATTPMAISTPAFVLATLGIFTIMMILAYLIFGMS